MTRPNEALDIAFKSGLLAKDGENLKLTKEGLKTLDIYAMTMGNSFHNDPTIKRARHLIEMMREKGYDEVEALLIFIVEEMNGFETVSRMLKEVGYIHEAE